MNLLANPKTAHVEVKPASDSILSTLKEDEVSHAAIFVVTGVVIGTTYLNFNATTSSGRSVQSQPEEIQVFEALKLSPSYITLVPTATFQVRCYSFWPHTQAHLSSPYTQAHLPSPYTQAQFPASYPGPIMLCGMERLG